MQKFSQRMGVYYKLVGLEGQELNVGDSVRDFRNDPCVIKEPCVPPRHGASSGHITLGYKRLEDAGYDRYVYPEVINAKWEEVDPLAQHFDRDRFEAQR